MSGSALPRASRVLLEVLAWGSLAAAFVIGQIASQIDYQGLLHQFGIIAFKVA